MYTYQYSTSFLLCILMYFVRKTRRNLEDDNSQIGTELNSSRYLQSYLPVFISCKQENKNDLIGFRQSRLCVVTQLEFVQGTKIINFSGTVLIIKHMFDL